MSILLLNEQGATPSTPASGKLKLYAKADGRLYGLDDTGAEFSLSLSLPIGIANGGTGQTSQTNAYDALSPNTTKGDLTVHNGTDNVRRAVGSNGQVLTADSAEATGVKWATPGAGTTFDPTTSLVIYDDFASGTADVDEIGNYCWRNTGAGTGNSFDRFSGVSGHPGIVRLIAGTVATGRQAIHLGDAGTHFMVLGGGAIVCEAVVRLTGVLTGIVSAQVGLGDNFTAVTDHTNGVYFEVTTTDTNWQLVSRSGGVSTRRDTGIAYASATWFRLRFTVNAAAASIQASINGTDAGAAITTNIPAAAISPFAKTVGIAAGSSTPWDIDYYYLTQTFTTAR